MCAVGKSRFSSSRCWGRPRQIDGEDASPFTDVPDPELAAVRFDGAAADGQSTVLAANVKIGGAKAQVSFSGLAPGFVGLYQVNAVIPSGLAGGNQPVVVTVGGSSSNSALLPIR